MEQAEWAKREAAGIGARVAYYRDRSRISAQELAERCAALGFPSISRVVIAKLETGRREAVSTAELKVLAAALAVPPVMLLFPLGQAEAVEALPGRVVHPWDGVRWLTGEIPDLDGGRADGSSPVSLYSLHHHLVSQWSQEQAAAAAAMKAAGETGTPEAMHQAALEMESASYLPVIRNTMRVLGYLPPDLPPEISAALGEEPSS
jgi:transcriptional regulator with XRE-family HTH domain